jgi:hypothetical protein
MKKSFSIIFATAIALSTVFVGCKKDIEEDPDANYIEGERMNFTVQVVSGENQTKSTSGLEGATVTLSGVGESQTGTADASGFANFTDLEEGTYSVNISMSGYTSLSATVEISDGFTGNNSNASVQFTLFNMTATVGGYVYMNLNTTNDTSCIAGWAGNDTASHLACGGPEFAPTTMVVTAVSQINVWNYSNSNNFADITDLTYEGLNVSTNVASDGSYTMTLAGSIDGLDYNVYFPDFAIQQVQEDPTDPDQTVQKRYMWNGRWTGSFDAVSGVTYVHDEMYD